MVIRACLARYGLLTVLVAALLAWAGTNSGVQETKPAARGYIAERVASANARQGSGTLAFPGRPAATTQPPTTQQPSPTAAPTSTQRTRMPAWLKLVIGLVAIIFAVQVARRASGRGNTGRP